MTTDAFEQAFGRVRQLVRDFEANKHYFLSNSYQEIQCRKDFVDKFFILLGWDVNHETQKNPYEQEVKIELNVQGGTFKRRADYAFSVGPRFQEVQFFVEAKRPQLDITDADSYFQAIRYSWGHRLPIVVLSDFHSLHLIDTRYQPNIDTATDRAIKKYSFTQYANKEVFAEIYFLLSRESVVSGAIPRFAETLPKPRVGAKQFGLFKGGYQSVDDSFLDELDDYRKILANAFHRQNPALDQYVLTELVQRTLDRLVFLRFLEDKLIEPTPLVRSLGSKGDAWKEFISTSRRLDSIYNGIVFKEHKLLDSSRFHVDEKVFGDICETLSDFSSPYDFNNIPISILGSIYERFLGKVIVIRGKTVIVDEKPEVRKAGGVFYTPEYIVQALVEGTVGKLVEGKSPEQIARMRFGDIACGSGSFLIGVFDHLLRYHGAYYNDDKQRVKRGDCIERDGMLHLSLKRKREILINNIYGVDIDPQAVEVAQLSLYLKLLDGETTASASNYQHEIHQAILPPLNRNIVCGNSLLGTDIFSGQLFPDEDERRINPLDFAEAFPTVVKSGGFDAIVGNPPYVRIQVMKEWAPVEVELYKKRYQTTAKGNYDLYVAFVERGLQLLNKKGRLGYILPNKFMNAKYGEPLRGLIASGRFLDALVHFGSNQVFAGATTYTCLLFLDKSSPRICRFSKVDDLVQWRTSGVALAGDISTSSLLSQEWNFVVGADSALFEKLQSSFPKLNDVADIFVGLQTSADDVFIMNLLEETKGSLKVFSKAMQREYILEKAFLRPVISGTDVGRYAALPKRQFILFPYEVEAGRAEIIPFRRISEIAPRTATYLQDNKKRLEDREKGRGKGPEWYGYIYRKNLTLQATIKLCVPRLVETLFCTMDRTGTYFLDNVDVCGIKWNSHTEISLELLLGLLNSKLLRWYFPYVSAPFRGGYMSANRQFLGQVPIALPGKKNRMQGRLCLDIVKLVGNRLLAEVASGQASTDKHKNMYFRKCTVLDKEIDQLVYQLYGLDTDEVSLVEGVH